jgi:hypothetical protein
VNKQYVAKIGALDENTSVVSNEREILVPARDEFYAHKQALNECNRGEDVLTITRDGVVVFDYKRGFNPR